jgi:hypothetical protein
MVTPTPSLTSNVSGGFWYCFLSNKGHPHPLPHSKHEWRVGRVPGLATYTRLKVGRETGARYLHYMEVRMKVGE